MKKEVSKELLNKYIKKDIEPIIRYVIIDVINLLSKKGYNVIRYIKKVNSTDFILYNGNKMTGKPIINVINGKEKEIKINWNAFEGFHIPVIELNENNEPFLYKNICAINETGTILKKDKCFKQKIIHEFLHLLSSSDKIIKEDKYIYYSGMNKYEVEIEENELKHITEGGGIELNEATTELLANNLYKELYDNEFFMPFIEKDGLYYPFINEYYINTNLLRIMNLFATGIGGPEKLLFSYLNNDRKMYVDILKDKLGLDEENLLYLMYGFQKNMLLYFEKWDEGEKFFKKNILNVFETLVYNLNINIQNLEVNNSYKKVYVSYIKKYVSIICDFPIFSSVKEDFMKFLETIEIK